MQTSCFGYRFRRGDFQSKHLGVTPDMCFSRSQNASSCQWSIWVCTAWHRIIPVYWHKNPFCSEIRLNNNKKIKNSYKIWVEICIVCLHISKNIHLWPSTVELQNPYWDGFQVGKMKNSCKRFETFWKCHTVLFPDLWDTILKALIKPVVSCIRMNLNTINKFTIKEQ